MLDAMLVVGTRPNLPKAAPLYRALKDLKVDVAIIDTGQHYDKALFENTYRDMKLPSADFSLTIGPGNPAIQSAKVIVGINKIYREHRPRMTIVVGDVTSTFAAAFASHSLGVPVAHLEAGIRSGDETMPEEMNRILTDRISSLLLAPTTKASYNLTREHVNGKITVVGNTMIDSLEKHRTDAEKRAPWKKFKLTPDEYGLVTLHRPALVDDDKRLKLCLQAIASAAERHDMAYLFPAHPRTRAAIDRLGGLPGDRILLADPIGYVEFLGLMTRARLVITDSGGIQEETAVLGVPCITYRETTERPETMSYGMNQLVGMKPARLAAAIDNACAKGQADRWIADVPMWDGRAAERAATVIHREVRNA